MTGDDRARAAGGDVHAETGPHGSLRICLAAPERRNSLRPATLTALLAALAAADPGALAAVKRIATSGGLLDRLRDEPRRNAEAWDGRAPS